jgi:hypothetical protein
MQPRVHILLASALATLAACGDKDDDTSGDEASSGDYGDCDAEQVDALSTDLDEEGTAVACLADLESQDECDQIWSDLGEGELASVYGSLVDDGVELVDIECGPMWLDGGCCAVVVLEEVPEEDEDDGVDEGRPFLVHGARRQAPTAEGAGWSLSADVAAVPAVHRAAVVAHWTRVGQMEHASVAAFARFSMALMHHGAPAELIEGAHVAALDEVRHARLCFGLAQAIGGERVAPRGLDMAGALDGELALDQITRTLVAEGCVGETLAALQAGEGARKARDPAVRVILEGIAADETRHAALAWRTLRWLVEQHPHLVEVARGALAEASARVPAAAGRAVGLEAHGCLDPVTRVRIQRVGLRDVVGTLANETLGVAPVGALAGARTAAQA